MVAMSGGVDSSVAAALLKEQNYNVIGITCQIWPEGAQSEGQGCCSLDAVEDARRVAAHLDIPHYVLNLRQQFEEAVIQDFIDEYAAGRTPNPCVRCNERVKFQTLLERAETLGADYLATGHYAVIRRGDDGSFQLHRAHDHSKDQSYVLYMLGQYELSRTLFPLGGFSKDAIREMARGYGLQVWKKPDSQEICFVSRNGYKEFITQRRPELASAGAILDLDGKQVGQHSGAVGYTIGQRRGIGVASSQPLYVVDIDSARNTITVGPDSALLARSVVLDDMKWVAGSAPSDEIAVTCKVRYNMPTVPALARLAQEGWEIVFEKPERAPTPGQAAVVFQDSLVLGGGTIRSVSRLDQIK